MGFLYQATISSGLPNPATSVETAILTTPVLTVGQGAGQINISGIFFVNAGTAATQMVLRCKQGAGVSNPQVGSSEFITVAAGSQYAIPFGWTDNPNFLQELNGGQYTITAQQTSATGNGASSAIDIEVTV